MGGTAVTAMPVPEDDAQGALLLAVWREFLERGRWPLFRQIDDELFAPPGVLDAHAILQTIPSELIYPPALGTPPSPTQLLKLTVAGIQWCGVAAGDSQSAKFARSELRWFIALVKLAAERRMTHSGSPRPDQDPELSFRDAIRMIGVNGAPAGTLTRLGLMLEVEPWGYSAASRVGEHDWLFRIRREARRFYAISTPADYWALRPILSKAPPMVSSVMSETMRVESSGLTQPRQLKVLYLTANPDLNLEVGIEVRQVQQAVRGALHRELVSIEYRPAATGEVLFEGINDVRPQIVHFTGHGGSKTLLLEEIGGLTGTTIGFELLAGVLAATDTPPALVILNACDTLEGADIFLERCQAVVAMSTSVTDLAATLFATQFYAAIASGQSVESAIKQGALRVDMAGLDEGWKIERRARDGVDLTKLVLVEPRNEDRTNNVPLTASRVRWSMRHLKNDTYQLVNVGDTTAVAIELIPHPTLARLSVVAGGPDLHPDEALNFLATVSGVTEDRTITVRWKSDASSSATQQWRSPLPFKP